MIFCSEVKLWNNINWLNKAPDWLIRIWICIAVGQPCDFPKCFQPGKLSPALRRFYTNTSVKNHSLSACHGSPDTLGREYSDASCTETTGTPTTAEGWEGNISGWFCGGCWNRLLDAAVWTVRRQHCQWAGDRRRERRLRREGRDRVSENIRQKGNGRSQRE